MANKDCIVCGINFYARPTELAAGRRFCSKTCKGIDMRGKPPGSATHMMYGSSTWKSWDGMKQRCLNPRCKDFTNYGARGITVDERWVHDFATFLNDMGIKPAGTSLGRIDNQLGYSPTNCRWETVLEQQNNRRSNRPVAAFGQTKNIAEWARQMGCSRQALRYRLSNGWNAEEAITTPIDRGNRWR